MAKFLYRPKHPEADENGFVPAEIAAPVETGPGFYITRDEMDPTRHMVTGEYFTSKAKFRELTKATGCLEVGNETNTMLKPRKPVPLDRGQRRDAIRRAIYELRNK